MKISIRTRSHSSLSRIKSKKDRVRVRRMKMKTTRIQNERVRESWANHFCTFDIRLFVGKPYTIVVFFWPVERLIYVIWGNCFGGGADAGFLKQRIGFLKVEPFKKSNRLWLRYRF